MIPYGVLFVWFDPVYPSQYFSVKSYQDGSFLGWTGTKQDLMCLACHVYFLQPCGYLLRNGWPLGSLVYDVFLLFLSPSHTIPCPGSCSYLIVSIPYLCLLYFAHKQYAVPPVRLKPATLLIRLKHSTTGYCTRILCGEQMKVSDYCYDLGVKGLGQYILQMWREFLLSFLLEDVHIYQNDFLRWVH